MSKGTWIELERNVDERDPKSAFIEAMEKPLPPGMFKGHHYDCERNVARLEREKQLLHERVEQLERIGACFAPQEGRVSVVASEYESLKADAEKFRALGETGVMWDARKADADLGALVRKIPIGHRLVHTDWEHLKNKWAVTEFYMETSEKDWHDTPEEALRAALDPDNRNLAGFPGKVKE